jgi:hypothetical protein
MISDDSVVEAIIMGFIVVEVMVKDEIKKFVSRMPSSICPSCK